MSHHARPLPSPPATPFSRPTPDREVPITPRPSPTEPASTVPPAPLTPSARADVPAPPAVGATALRPTLAPDGAVADRRRWYAREPWLAWLLAAFVPLGGALAVTAEGEVLPAPWPSLVLAAGGACLLVSFALLARQGPFRAAAPRRR